LTRGRKGERERQPNGAHERGRDRQMGRIFSLPLSLVSFLHVTWRKGGGGEKMCESFTRKEEKQGVAMMWRLLKITGVLCKRAL